MSDAVSEALEEVPLYPEEFVGWRGWVVEKGVLKSVNDREVWTPNVEFEAECSRGRAHDVPAAKCSCGLYSTKTLNKLRQNSYHNLGAFGMVSIWGNIVDGGTGYRSQFAYPRIIFVPFLSWKLFKGLERYGVPVMLGNPYTMMERN